MSDSLGFQQQAHMSATRAANQPTVQAHDFHPVYGGCQRCAALPEDGPICEGTP